MRREQVAAQRLRLRRRARAEQPGPVVAAVLPALARQLSEVARRAALARQLSEVARRAAVAPQRVVAVQRPVVEAQRLAVEAAARPLPAVGQPVEAGVAQQVAATTPGVVVPPQEGAEAAVGQREGAGVRPRVGSRCHSSLPWPHSTGLVVYPSIVDSNAASCPDSRATSEGGGSRKIRNRRADAGRW